MSQNVSSAITECIEDHPSFTKGVTVGDFMPGSKLHTSSILSFGMFSIIYFLSSAFLYDENLNSISSKIARFSEDRFLLPIIRASEYITTSTSFKLLLIKVLPELTISKIQSAKPMPGAISTEPVMVCISATTPLDLRKSARITGYEVAIFFPFNQLTPVYSIDLGMAMERRHLLKPSRL